MAGDEILGTWRGTIAWGKSVKPAVIRLYQQQGQIFADYTLDRGGLLGPVSGSCMAQLRNNDNVIIQNGRLGIYLVRKGTQLEGNYQYYHLSHYPKIYCETTRGLLILNRT